MITLKDIRHSILDDTGTGRVFREQTTMKRATCCRSLDGIKDTDKFNSKYIISNLAKEFTGKAIGNQQKGEPKFWRRCDEARTMRRYESYEKSNYPTTSQNHLMTSQYLRHQ